MTAKPYLKATRAMLKPQFELMAQYNMLMNRQLIEALNGLAEAILWEDKGAFFGSILGTLNHLMVGDLIWLRRFNQHPNYSKGFTTLQQLVDFPVPDCLTQTICHTLADYKVTRATLDDIIIGFIDEVALSDYAVSLTYTNTKGRLFSKNFAALLQHLFNHQTHHRGQVTTLLNQIGVDVGSTDLLMLID